MSEGNNSPVFFTDVRATPPGGKFFYRAPGGEYVEGVHFCDIERSVASLLVKYGDNRSPERAVAEYMCPRISGADWFCKGAATSSKSIRPIDAIRESLAYCSKPLVAFDEIERRMQTCLNCPMHEREWCPSCSGHLERINNAMRGKRQHLAEDRASGVCKCARAYEYAITSVEYGPSDKIWEGVPESCWRNSDV